MDSYHSEKNILWTSLSKGNGTSPDEDNVSYEMVSNLGAEWNHVSSRDYTIWLEFTFPAAWKNAIEVPILKPKKSHENLGSYRLISLTSFLCKRLERIINSRLTYLMDVRKLLNNNQSGFTKNCEPSDRTITLENTVETAFAWKDQVLVLFFQLKNAYNMVWRHGFLKNYEILWNRGC